jgi:AcrR family transcriptional regulator
MSVAVIKYNLKMGRWQPESRARLERAALELFAERGFQDTTVAEIAKRAGVTERTFFRHFTDKREVLFGGGFFTELLSKSVVDAPASASPLDAVAAALETAGELFESRMDFARRRWAIIQANPELQERELIKLAEAAIGIAGALRTRGVSDPAASLAAEAGVAVLKVAFERWIQSDGTVKFRDIARNALDELRVVTAAN